MRVCVFALSRNSIRCTSRCTCVCVCCPSLEFQASVWFALCEVCVLRLVVNLSGSHVDVSQCSIVSSCFPCLLGMRAQSPLLLSLYPRFPSLPSFSPANSLPSFLLFSCMPRVSFPCQCMYVSVVFSIRDNYLHTKHSSAPARVSHSIPGVTTKGRRETRAVLRYAPSCCCARETERAGGDACGPLHHDDDPASPAASSSASREREERTVPRSSRE